jgi:hypothetical protein
MVSAAAVRDVLPTDLSIATAVTRAASQVGQAIGVAIILVLLGNGAADIDRFRSCWWLLCALTVCAALMTIGLGPPKFNKGVLRPATGSRVAASVRPD